MNEIKNPDFCEYYVYSITPDNQPLIKDDVYYCRYCGNEVEPDMLMGIKVGWFHMKDGKFIDLKTVVKLSNNIMKGIVYLSDLEKVTRTMREYKLENTIVEVKDNRLSIDGQPICDLKME